MDMTVVTYGGGEILRNIFNALAMLMNGEKGGFLHPLMIITISIGSVWAFSKAFFSNSMQSLLSQFIIPLVAVVGLLMTPSTSVHIEDILKDRSYQVDHVPFLVAKFSELTSSIGYQITKAVEQVMHVPNDLSYNSTGMIFGSDTAMDIGRYQISNADLEKNLRSFTRQCVLYDVALGKYSLDDMKKSCDLWKFFEENTSKVRMIRYQPLGSEGKTNLGEYVTCKDAIKRMTPFFEKEKHYYGQLDVCKNLPLTFQALTGLQREKEELISQQLVMNALLGEYGGSNFAKGRAYLQQRNTYQALGALASSSLVTLRAVIEALVYASFIFIIPLSVLPRGMKYLMTWAGLVVWIQLWPPFYAILNYIMQSVGHGYAQTIFNGLAGANQGLSLFTSVGIQNLQHDIYALSGYLAASIPFLTYAILKGGVSSFIHLASSMMTPAHSASSTAAAEQTSGNYSFGNASMGQVSYQNTTGFQSNLAPSLATGFFQENKGTHSTTYGANEQILRQTNSDLRTSVFSDDSISKGYQKALMHSESALETSQQSYAESISASNRHLADLSDHLSKSESYAENFSQREAYDLQESARYFQNLSENWGKQHGMSTREAMETAIGLGIDFGITAKSTANFGSNKEHLLNNANSIVKSEEFQKHFQRLQDFAQSDAYNTLDEKGMRLVESTSHSLDEMKNSQHTYQVAKSNLDQVSDQATWAEQNSHLIRRSLNQDFINWASDQFAHQGGFAKVEDILTNGSIYQQEALVQDFISHVRQNNFEPPKGYVDPSEERHLPQDISIAQMKENIHEAISSGESHFSPVISEKGENISRRYSQESQEYLEKFGQVSKKIEAARQSANQDFTAESERSNFIRQFDEFKGKEFLEQNFPKFAQLANRLAFQGLKNKNPVEKHESKLLGNNFQVTEEPFWMIKENK